MGRWRPPPERSSPYITAAGHARLQAELKSLWPWRREVTAALSAAAAEGDRSENAEYIYRKKQLREIDGRIRYLQKRLDEVRVVHPRRDNPDRVFFGAAVVLADAHGEQVRYRIVGTDETDTADGRISVDSPVARSLLGREPGDEVTVPAPGGERRLEIVAIDYDEPDGSDLSGA